MLLSHKEKKYYNITNIGRQVGPKRRFLAKKKNRKFVGYFPLSEHGRSHHNNSILKDIPVAKELPRRPSSRTVCLPNSTVVSKKSDTTPNLHVRHDDEETTDNILHHHENKSLVMDLISPPNLDNDIYSDKEV